VARPAKRAPYTEAAAVMTTARVVFYWLRASHFTVKAPVFAP
jgi:hypothetical protein